MKSIAVLGVVFCGLGQLVWADDENAIYSSGGFEPPAYEPGSIRGQDQWDEIQGRSATITTDLVGEGIQALSLNSRAGEGLVRLEMRLAEPHEASFLLHPQGSSGPKAASELHIRGIDGGGNTFILQSFFLKGRRLTSDGGKIDPSLDLDNAQWRNVRIKLDPVVGVYSLYIDEVPIVESAPVSSGKQGVRVYAYDFTVRGEPDVDSGMVIDNFEIVPAFSD